MVQNAEIRIVPFLAFLFLVVGSVLLFDDLSISDVTQTGAIIGGATFLSLGLITLWIGVKNWWKSKITYREYRKE